MTVDKAIAWVVGVGASRGLGAAAARRFAREGFAVAVTGRSPDALAIIADEISTAGGHAIAAVTALVLGTVGASAGEQPQYEVAGFPITPHQISVLGSGGIQEQSPTRTLTLNGMPASPHQIAVIGPRTKQHISEKLNKDASDISAQTTN